LWTRSWSARLEIIPEIGSIRVPLSLIAVTDHNQPSTEVIALWQEYGDSLDRYVPYPVGPTWLRLDRGPVISNVDDRPAWLQGGGAVTNQATWGDQESIGESLIWHAWTSPFAQGVQAVWTTPTASIRLVARFGAQSSLPWRDIFVRVIQSLIQEPG